MNTCEICKNTFLNSYNLKMHKKNAKYCKNILNELNNSKIKCKYCDISFLNDLDMNNHLNSCKEFIIHLKNISNLKDAKIIELECQNKYLQNQLKELTNKLHDQNKELQNQLKDLTNKLIDRPNTINNITNNTSNISTKTTNKINNFNMLQPLTDRDFDDNVENLTIEHIIQGVEGYASFILDFPLKDKLLCVDYNRKKICYKNETGEKIEDPEMTKLSSKIFKSIKEKNNSLINEYLHKLREEEEGLYSTTDDFNDDSEEFNRFNENADYIHNLLMKYLELKNNSIKTSEGINNDMKKDLVKIICNKIVK